MENLTKHQIVLLTLLVSFVTSIATGIVTVALMNQVPIGVSQTINRVVERTIEQVVATSTIASISQQPTTKETIVVSEDDQVVSAINKNAGSVVRIYQKDTDAATDITSTDFVAMGAVVSDDGMIATDNGVIFSSGTYFIKTDDGALHPLTVLEADPTQTVALLKISTSTTSPLTLPKTTLAKSDLQLGQAVVYIGGEAKNSVATGIVSSLGTKNISSDTSSSTAATNTASTTSAVIQTQINSIDTSISQDSLIPGGLLFNLSGELVGIKSAYTTDSALFAPITLINAAITSVADSQTSQ